MKLRYFAWVRERIGTAEETVEPPETVATVGDLLFWLQGRGETYAFALAEPEPFTLANFTTKSLTAARPPRACMFTASTPRASSG